MLKKLNVEGLNHRLNIDLSFNDDLNILTGKNGSGKTTVLKLIWYLISGNVERVIPEIDFEYVNLSTDRFSIEIKSTRNSKQANFELSLVREGDTSIDVKLPLPLLQNDFNRVYERRAATLDEINNAIVEISKSSVFFPTFRRIEGGFSIDKRQRVGRLKNFLQDGMSELAERLSVNNQKFVSSISTEDIVELLTKRYADISKQTNELQSKLSEFIIAQINDYSKHQGQPETEKLRDATLILDTIQKEVSKVTAQREDALQPFSVLSDFIGEIFKDKSIEVTESIKLGQTEEAISSEKLSAGEKQMLSFLCYNALSEDSYVFIDEPELSLHVDWQRLLFPKLLSQSTNNQFIVATHSPFIYSKYPDKELILDADRGNS
jgi:predicted ATP-binding protein involved in virulence